MDSVRVGGRSYSDPDLVDLVRKGGGLADPRSLVLTQVRRLNELYRRFDSDSASPFERLKHIASLCGLDVLPMELVGRSEEQRDAVILMNGASRGKRGQIFYNPNRSAGRIHFSIAHEIVHTFVPPTIGGARFREMCNGESPEGNELERLCDAGASEILMPTEEFRAEVGTNWSIESVPTLLQRFGSSFEATTFRLASAHPNISAAGMLKFRLRKEEIRAVKRQQSLMMQEHLFSELHGSQAENVPIPKYRRQSFYTSDTFPVDLYVHWNKSFDDSSIAYAACTTTSILKSHESLPCRSRRRGTLEVVVAPFQRADADPQNPDLLFFWSAA